LIWNLESSPVYLLAGIDVAYILYANSILDYNDENIRDSDNNETNNLNRLNTSLLFGMGFKWNAFSKTMGARLDYAIGITNIAKKGDWVTDFYSRDITLSWLFFF
jgi:hypothetical protein